VARIRVHAGPIGISVGSSRRGKRRKPAPTFSVVLLIAAILISPLSPHSLTIPAAIVLATVSIGLAAQPKRH
jgi:hypothetical protein